MTHFRLLLAKLLIVIFSSFLLCWDKITSLTLSVLKHPPFHYLAFSKSSYLSALMMMMTVTYLFNLNSTACYFLFSFFIRMRCFMFSTVNLVVVNLHVYIYIDVCVSYANKIAKLSVLSFISIWFLTVKSCRSELVFFYYSQLPTTT